MKRRRERVLVKTDEADGVVCRKEESCGVEACVCRRRIRRKFEEAVKACEHWKSDSRGLGR